MGKILVADDHAIVRKGLKRFLEEVRDLKVTVNAATGREALTQIKRKRPNMVIMDLHLQGVDALAFLKQLAQRRPRIPVLIYTDYPERDMAVSALKLGAEGYLTKDRPWEELVAATRKILEGHKFITDSLAETLAAQVQSPSAASAVEKLSKRERQITSRLVAGQSIKEIGNELSLRPSTVSTYRTRILEKFGFRNNAELIRFATESQLALSPKG